MIIRGTTPTLEFELPIDTMLLQEAFVIIRQRKKTIIEKPLSSCVLKGNVISATLEQAETLSLSADAYAEINLVILTLGGNRLEMEPLSEQVVGSAKDGVI